jgi:alkylation response protein AidB-like acyl-CoA dehydrogenase
MNMDVAFTPEHEELRQAVRRFLEKESPEPVVRAVMETDRGFDERTWRRMAGELGLPGLAIPERFGGGGLGPVEIGIVMEEMGRVLFCGPYLSTAVLSVTALLHAAGDEARAELLPEIASGRAIVALAVAEASGRPEAAAVEACATREGEGWRLDGVKSWIVDGAAADVLLVAARADDGVSLFRVEGAAPGVTRTALPTLDLTRKLARIELAGATASRIGPAGDGAAAIDRVIASGAAALAAEQTGGAARCLEIAVEYARTRLQFGRPIGSFQAIKHKCADMLVEVEFARSAAYEAVFRAAADDPEELTTAALVARSYCSEAFFHAAAETIQIHGGMGFTWEHPAHLYFKRAKSSAVLFGDPVDQRQKLARRIGL